MKAPTMERHGVMCVMRSKRSAEQLAAKEALELFGEE